MSEEVKEMRDGSFLCVNEEGKAYWGQSEGGGGGGGVQVVTFTGESPNALTSSHTGAEILEMAEKGLVIAKIVSDPLNSVLPLVTVNNYTGAMFLMASGALLTGLCVDLDGTAVKTYNYAS